MENSYNTSQKYNGKELDRMHGLDLYDYGARQYDPSIGMFTSIDPMCEKYYNVSPYVYCVGNPVRYVDPDGRDIWELNKQGNVAWREKSKIHQLIALDDKGNRTNNILTVNDRSILDGLAKLKYINGGLESYAITNSKEVGQIFLFVSNNSDVEWNLQGFSKNGLQNYLIGTSHLGDHVSSNLYKRLGQNENNMTFNMHSHPSVENDIRGASGGEQKNYYGDMLNITMMYYRFRDEYKKELPLHYVYHRNTKTLYQYTPWDSSIKISAINNINPLKLINMRYEK